MSEIFTVGLDLAKKGVWSDSGGRAVLHKKLSRVQVLEFFAQLPTCVVDGSLREHSFCTNRYASNGRFSQLREMASP